MKTASIRLLCGVLFFTVSGAFSAADTLAVGVFPVDEIVSQGQTVSGMTVFADDDAAKEERERKKEEREKKKAERKAEREKKKAERKARLEEKRNKGGMSSH